MTDFVRKNRFLKPHHASVFLSLGMDGSTRTFSGALTIVRTDLTLGIPSIAAVRPTQLHCAALTPTLFISVAMSWKTVVSSFAKLVYKLVMRW